MARRFLRALVVLALAFLGVLSFEVLPANAHAGLTSSSPAEGSIVDAVPAAVVLTFDEPVRPVRDRVHVLGPDGNPADHGTPTVIGPTVRIHLHPGAGTGTYVVNYAVISDDNHEIGAAFTFFVGTKPTVSAPVAGFGGTPDGWTKVALPIARWIGYLGLCLLVGAAVMLGWLWPRHLDRWRATRVMSAGAVMLAGTTTIEVGVQIITAAAGSRLRGRDVGDFLLSRSGLTHEARLAVLVVLAFVLGPIAAGTARTFHRIAAMVLFTAGLSTYALGGHPQETPTPVISVLADLLHIGAMSVWLGGLIMLAAFVLPRADADDLTRIVPLWSAGAGYAVSTLLLTGITQSLLQIGSFSLLLETGYGRLVLAKSGILVAILLVALGSRRTAAAMARPVPGGAPRLRRLVAVESTGILVVLALTAVLVQTPPARADQADRARAAVQTLRLTSAIARVQVMLDPGRTGLNRLDLNAVAVDGTPARIKVWSGTASPPDREIANLDLGLLAITPGHAVGQVRLPVKGTWRLTLTLVDAELRSATMSTTVNLD